MIMQLEKGEEIEAFCYLEKANDENNKCYLTNQNLIVIKNGKIHAFPNENIVEISFHHRKLLFLIILGGILVPLTFLLIFRIQYQSWIILLLLFIGILTLYFGYAGRLALTVTTILKEYNIFINEITPNLKAFTDFSTNYIKAKTGKIPSTHNYIEVILPLNTWEKQQNEESFFTEDLNETGYIKGYTYEMKEEAQSQIRHMNIPLIILKIDPLKSKSKVEYVADKQTSRLAPRFLNPIHKNAIIDQKIISTSPISK
jgi:uncharacterized protein (DUF952 family)